MAWPHIFANLVSGNQPAAYLDDNFNAISPDGGFLQAGTGAVLRTNQNKERDIVSVFDFMSSAQISDVQAGTLTLDVTLAVQAAIDSVCPSWVSGVRNAGRCKFPQGKYLVTSALNCTNSRTAGTLSRDGLMLDGDNATIVGQTGAGNPIIETTGSQWLTITRGITLDSTAAGAGKSTLGIFSGVSTVLTQTQNQRIACRITMHDDATANGNIGTVAVWNYGAEETTYDNIYWNADIPFLGTGHNPTSNFTSTTPKSYQTLSASHSLGMTTFSGQCFLVTLNKRQPSIITEDVNSIKFDNSYLANTGGLTGTNQSAWKVYGSVQGADFNGTVESHGRIVEVTGALQGAKIRVTFGTIDSVSIERILLNRGGQGQLINCDFNFQDNVSPARALFSATPSAANELISCYIQNSCFRVNADKQYTTIQENVLWNPNNGNILIEALHNTNNPYRYEIDSVGKQKVAVPLTSVWINGGITSAEVVRFIMPTIISTANALSAEIRLRGILVIQGNSTNAKATKYFEAALGIAVSQTGVITLSNAGTADNFEVGTAATVNSAGNNITAVTVTGVNQTTYVQIVVAPTRSGANNETVQFIGEAELNWSGNESRAPSLQTLS